MNILFIATKAPWPPVDGGRLLVLHTLEGLRAAGHRVTFVAPVDPGSDLDSIAAALRPFCTPRLVAARPAGWPVALGRAVLRRMPLSVARHALRPVAEEVARLLAAESFDIVHAEQLQAFSQVPAEFPATVLRAQNVESALWKATGERRGGLTGSLLRLEARRLAAWEGRAVARAAATVALTSEDAASLRTLAGSTPVAAVAVVAAPFPAELPAGSTALSGSPAVVVLGSAGWLPNAESAAWFAGTVWPQVRAALPGAVLHLFGAGGGGAGDAGDTGPGIVHHPSPRDSSEAFAPGSILAVPVRIASGVRMKILEAWARGVPVVATPEAVAGLGAVEGRELLVAREPAELAAALARLHSEPDLAARLVSAGRAALVARHAPAAVTGQLVAVYERVLARR